MHLDIIVQGEGSNIFDDVWNFWLDQGFIWLNDLLILRVLICTPLFFTWLSLLNLANGFLASSRLSSQLFALGASLAEVELIILDVSNSFIIVDEYLTVNVIPLLALVTADPVFAVEELLVFLEVHLLAVVTVLLLVVCLRAHIAQPEGLVVWILLAGPETIRLISCRYILLRADNIFTAS